MNEPVTLRPDLLDILACPKCKGEVLLSDSQEALVCEACRLRYAVRDGIPIMLISEAEAF